MFFLEKIFTKFIGKMKFQREYKEFATNLEKVTNIKYEDLKRMYSQDILSYDPGKPKQYVEYDFLSRFDLYACSYCFPASIEATKKIEVLINEFFIYFENRLYTRINAQSQTESLLLVISDMFAVKEVEIVTNSDVFIELINETPMTCPPPWLAFPGLAPYAYIPTQGDLEYYNKLYWKPFWSNLEENEKEHYYATENIPEGWEKHMRFLDEPTE